MNTLKSCCKAAFLSFILLSIATCFGMNIENQIVSNETNTKTESIEIASTQNNLVKNKKEIIFSELQIKTDIDLFLQNWTKTII